MIARALALSLVLLAVLAGGIWLGGNPSNLPEPVREALVDDSQTQRFDEALGVVGDTFYREVPEEKLVGNAITGMVDKLDDPYSQYFTPKQYAEFQRSQAQQFSGIGVAVGEDDKGLRILKIYDDSPAGEAGLKIDDVIISADGRKLAGLPQDRAVALVKGPEGTKVALGISRKDRGTRTVPVVRRAIVVPSVDSRVRTFDGERYQQIAVAGFTQRNVTEQVEAEIREGEQKKVKGIILDLRSNPGGLVTEAQGVTGLFLPEGKVVTTTKGRSVPTQVVKTEGDPEAPKIPLVVLVDKRSASASEIVAGALQDHKRATLVGSRTYGKGVFQQVIELDDGGALDLTAGQYFTPNGRNLGGRGSKQGTGLAPDVKVPGTEQDRAWQDKALETALETLAKKAQ
ncbi:MAG: S41 family peptidase [Baekduia sp.]